MKSAELAAGMLPDREIHIIADNLSAHKTAKVVAFLDAHPNVQLHYTPTYASWLNLVERFFGLLTEKALRRGSHTSIAQLRAAIVAYVVLWIVLPREDAVPSPAGRFTERYPRIRSIAS